MSVYSTWELYHKNLLLLQVILNCGQLATLSYFSPSLIFSGKARSPTSEWSLSGVPTKVGSNLGYNIREGWKLFAVTNTILAHYRNSYSHKSFIAKAPRTNISSLKLMQLSKLECLLLGKFFNQVQNFQIRHYSSCHNFFCFDFGYFKQN